MSADRRAGQPPGDGASLDIGSGVGPEALRIRVTPAGIRSWPGAQRGVLFSLGYACEGLRHGFMTQRNLRLQALVGCSALTAACLLRLPAHQIVLVVALTALVLFAELMNTAIESLLDHHAGTAFDPSVKAIKDMAAASVLVACVAAVVLGASVFLPAIAPGLFR